MPQETIKQILMRRDLMSADEADCLIEDAKREFHLLLEAGDFISAEDICADWFGLEPDYLEELI